MFEDHQRINFANITLVVSIIILSVTIASLIITYHWIELILVITGSSFVIFTFLYPLKAFLFWLITSPILNFYLKIPMGAGIPDITFNRITIFFLFFVFLVRVMLHLIEFHPLGKIETCMFIFFLVAIFTISLNPNKIPNLQMLIDFHITPFIVFFLSKNLFREEKEIKNLYWALSLTGIYLAVIGIIEFFVNKIILVPSDFVEEHGGRAGGPFVSPIQYGTVMVIIFFCTLYLLWAFKSHKIKIISLCALTIIGFAVVLSLTRSAWLSLFVGVFIIQHYYPQYRWRFISLTCFAGLITFLITFFSIENNVITNRIIDSGPIYNRIISNVAAVKMALSKPLFGYGYGTDSFLNASRKYMTSVGSVKATYGAVMNVPHNEFLHVLVLTGFVGFIFYLAIFFYGFKSSLSLFKMNPQYQFLNKDYLLFFWAIFSVFIINGFFVDIMFYNYFSSLFYLLLGIIDGQRVICSEKIRS